MAKSNGGVVPQVAFEPKKFRVTRYSAAGGKFASPCSVMKFRAHDFEMPHQRSGRDYDPVILTGNSSQIMSLAP